MFLYDAAAHPETETSSLFTLGGIEGSKEIFPHTCRYPASAVSHRNPHTLAHGIGRQAGVAYVQNQLSASGHCVDCITDQVGEQLPKLSGITANRQGSLKPLIDLDVALSNLRSEQGQHTLQHFCEINLYWSPCFAVECQQLAGNLRDSAQFVASHFQILHGCCALPCLMLHQVNEVRNRVQGIPDLVCDGC